MNSEHVVIIVFGLVLLLALWSFFGYFTLWQRAWLSGVPVSFTVLIAMRLRQVPVKEILDVAILLHKAGLPVPVEQLEAHSLSSGDVDACAKAYIGARAAGIPIDWGQVCVLDLAGKATGETVDQGIRRLVETNRL